MVLLYNCAFPINLNPSSGCKSLMSIGIIRNVFYLIHNVFYLLLVLSLIAVSQSFMSDSSTSSPLCLFYASPNKHAIKGVAQERKLEVHFGEITLIFVKKCRPCFITQSVPCAVPYCFHLHQYVDQRTQNPWEEKTSLSFVSLSC